MTLGTPEMVCFCRSCRRHCDKRQILSPPSKMNQHLYKTTGQLAACSFFSFLFLMYNRACQVTAFWYIATEVQQDTLKILECILKLSLTQTHTQNLSLSLSHSHSHVFFVVVETRIILNFIQH